MSDGARRHGDAHSINPFRLLPARARDGLIVATATLVASCGTDTGTPSSAWAGQVQHLPGGATIVSNPAGGMWDSTTAWTLDETLRIGSVEGDGPDVFGRIAALEVDSAGRIYIFDEHASELRVFGPDGGLVRRLGRQGAGPGEFKGVIGMSLAPDGAVWLIDAANARYTIIDGVEPRVHRRIAPMYRLPWLGGFAQDGSFYDGVIVLPGQDGRTEVLLRVDETTGAVIDTLPVTTTRLDVPRLGTMEFPLPYAPRVIRTFDRRGYIWTAVSGEYRLVQRLLGGDTAKIVSRDYRAAPLTSTQTDSVNRYVRRLEGQFGVHVASDQIPRSKPIINWFVVDDLGYVWVCRAAADSCASLDVFDDAGRFLGGIEPPFRLTDAVAAIVRNDDFYAVTEGELGVPIVVRARVVKR